MTIDFGEFVRLFNIENRDDWLLGLRVDQQGVWKGSITKQAMDSLTPYELEVVSQTMEVEETYPILRFPTTRRDIDWFLERLDMNREDFPHYNKDDFWFNEDELISCSELLIHWCGNNFDKGEFNELSNGLARLAQEGEVRIYDLNHSEYLEKEDLCDGFLFTSECISPEDAEKARVLLGLRQQGINLVDWSGEKFISIYGASLRIAWDRYPDKKASGQLNDYIYIGLERHRQYKALHKDIDEGLIDVFDPEGERIRNGCVEDCSLMRLSDLNQWLSKNIPSIRINAENCHSIPIELKQQSSNQSLTTIETGKTVANNERKRFRQIKALIQTIEKLGFDPLALEVGDSQKGTIHKGCLEDHKGTSLFTDSRETFNGIWKDAASGKYDLKIVVINRCG